MIEVIRKKIQDSSLTRETKIHIIREFLQILILKILHDKNIFKNLTFIGGTALRIVYNLQRFSEDLDFSLLNKKDYNFLTLLRNLKKELELYNLPADMKYKQGTVDNCFIRFHSILQAFDLHKHHEEKISIKIEIDTNPPQGAHVEIKLINMDFIFPVKIFDLPSLMSGKLHAILCRKFHKGRDFYDLLWYLTKKITPNITLLNNAIMQTEGKSLKIDENNWKKVLLNTLKKIDFHHIRKDVLPFLADKKEADMIKFSTYEKLCREQSF